MKIITVEELSDKQRDMLKLGLQDYIHTAYATVHKGVMQPLIDAGWFVKFISTRPGMLYRYQLTAAGAQVAKQLSEG